MRFTNLLKNAVSSRSTRWISIPMLLLAAVGSWVVQSQVTAPVLPPTMNLAAEPLYARGARAKPTLTLALSVEFPTVGAQYVSAPQATEDASYAPGTEYLGYFDAESCYTYNNNSDASLRRFDRSGDAARDSNGNSLRTCGGTGFSGNFMNWATSSAIDILRFGLTGGDRVVDTSSLTVLQRAVLPNTSVSNNFWNGSNFPAKRLVSTLATGAVPDSLRGTYTGDIFVANCLNRTHFGTAATGSCANPGNNSNLGVTTGATANGPVTNYTGTLPTDFSPSCAVEGNTCAFTGILQVAYGAGSSWRFVSANNGVGCNNTVFGDPIVGTQKRCYTRPDPTGWSPGGTTGITSDNFFYARVSVCGTDGSGALTDPRSRLCLRYPSGNFKPVGNLQRYSDRVRVAAFGYLNDSTGNPNQRYGGVLRAPMKYVGSRTFDSNFQLVSGANPAAEWNDSTGVFLENPNNASEGVSGVTNYLNRFGRTGPTPGQYKTYDPVGELYYESLRYLQGLPPTPAAVSGITTAMRDGFPVYDTWLQTDDVNNLNDVPDPHPAVSGMTDYSCVKNNIVGIGDVNTHNDKTIPGNPIARALNDSARAVNVSANEPDFWEWTRVVGGFESNNAVTYADNQGVNRTTSNPNTANTARWGMENTNIGADRAAYYIAGMAYWANTHDIRGTGWSDTAARRPGMRVTTYFIDVNEYGQQTNPTTHRGGNQFYLAAKYGGFIDRSGRGNPFIGADGTTNSNLNWERQTTDADKREAKNYFLSSSAQDVLDSLDEIFRTIAEEANSIAGGAISTQRLTSVGGFIYQAQFDPADWSGDLVAYTVGVSGNTVNLGDAGTSPWQAAARLDSRVLSGSTDRRIFVGRSAPSVVAGTAAEFRWGSLETVQQDALRAPPYAAASAPLDSATVGQNRLAYLRGDRLLEAPVGTMRRRGSRLGDIVNSGVAFSGAPVRQFADADYATFVTNYSSRKKALFVGANDGMLHAFDADTGDELFAYIPSWLVPRLPNLTATNYTHQSYLDGSPTVAEAKVGSDWRTVLVSGAGGGGQGVFALDVSNPDPAVTGGFSASSVLWEFSDRDDPDMGNVIGRPHIVKLRTSAAGASTTTYEYFAVVASGVNNHLADGHASSTGEPALFMLSLNKSPGTAWAAGTNYYKVRFPVASNYLPTGGLASGMAGFSVRLGFANELTYLYAGDMHGNLWKLDFTQQGASGWSLANLSFFRDGSAPIPMFVARDNTPIRQPITMEPALAFGPNRSVIVSFGTGKYLESTDNSAFRVQSVYALYDNNNATADSTSPGAAIAGRGRLQAGTASSTGVSVPDFNWGRPLTDGDALSRSGWYFDFLNSSATGERQISGFGLLAGRLVFGSVIPAVSSCDNGTGNLYIVNLGTGDATSVASTVGILGEPFLAQVGNTSVSDANTTGGRRGSTRYQIILQGSAGLAAPASLSQVANGALGRLSWREISNYQEIRNTP